ncbi:hypothetical protein ACP2W0_19310 [Pseudobacillus badius]|uniref:hypothetical protein n=1 Tax=Bacillus badius TaxID=1455 RepID=UPI003CF77D22
MKKKTGSILCVLFTVLLLSACQKNYSGSFSVEWGLANEENQERLKENDIPYKIESGKIYIPEDAIDDATKCCS